MQKRTREILAVLLLVLLVLVGVGAMCYSMLVGHNWNVAASHIDDSIGRLEGYTVIVYEGTQPVGGVPEATDGFLEPTGKSAVDMNDVVESYREKGARVFKVDAGDLARYTEPFVVGKGDMRVGLFAVGKATLRSAARACAKYLKEHDSNYTIALTNDTALWRSAEEGLIGDVSIIVCDDPKGEFPDGRYCGSTFCVRTPHIGEVGALIISPSGVLSAKTVDGLKLSERDEDKEGQSSSSSAAE